MKLFNNLKVNRIKNPIGYSFDHLSFSFDLTESASTFPEHLELRISAEESFDKIVHSQDIKLIDRYFIDVTDMDLNSQTRYYWSVFEKDSETPLTEQAYFETGLLTGFKADFIVTEQSDVHPVFYKTFSLKDEVSEARLYISGVGLYEASINQSKVGKEYLTPYCNDYDQFIQYQTYEVEDLKSGENQIEVSLGNGWYKGKFGLDQKEDIFGDQFGCIAELHVSYSDGSKEVIRTDTSWKARPSVIEASDMYDGEVVDYQRNTDETLTIDIDNDLRDRLKERMSLPVVEKETLVPELIVTDEGQNILDFKQNMVGFVRFNTELKAGETVKLSFGEILQDDAFYRDNLRTAKAEFTVTGDGTSRMHRSHFTFFGFRYVLVEGLEDIDPRDFEGVVIYSDIDETGFIQTSEPMIDQLVKNAKWGQRGNFLDVPTDCPQRDERLGWTADAQVFARTASYNMDSLAFYRKYMEDLRNDQLRYDGGIPNYSPSFKESMEAGSVWGDAATIIPMVLYEFYGDKNLLSEHYSIMRDYIEHVRDRDRENGDNRLYDDGFHFGDWLAQDGMNEQSLKGATDDYYIASMYYYHSAKLVSKAAAILGKDSDVKEYSNLAEEIRQAILHEYFSPSGRLTIDTQTGYVLALYMGVFIDKDKIITGIKDRLKKDYYRIKSGFVGTPLICKVLADNGLVTEAYRLLFEEDTPSWLYQVKMGATTIWERWNSVLPNGKISGINMNSLNHYAYGSIVEFLYANVAGLKPVEPGFKAVKIKPTPHFELKEMNTEYHSVSGTYRIKWALKEDKKFHIQITRPYGTDVVVELPDFDSDLIVSDGEGEWLTKDKVRVTSETFECEYTMSVDHLRPYSLHSVVLDLLKNEEAVQVLKETVPGVYAFVTGENDEFSAFRMTELVYLPMTFMPESVQKDVDEKLRSIKV